MGLMNATPQVLHFRFAISHHPPVQQGRVAVQQRTVAVLFTQHLHLVDNWRAYPTFWHNDKHVRPPVRA